MGYLMLWMEFENSRFGAYRKKNAAARVLVEMSSGKKYEINVYMFKYLKTAVKKCKRKKKNLNGRYHLPPDLFVKKLTRPIIEKTISWLIKKGEFEKIIHQRCLR